VTDTSKPVETLTEWAVRFDDGMIWERPNQHAAQTSARGVTARGGQATVMSRQVTRTAWTEEPPQETT
jgi:hypothetical protein